MISEIAAAISPAWHPQKSSQHVRACAAGDGPIRSKNREIIPYHRDNPNTRNAARVCSLSPIKAPSNIKTAFTCILALIKSSSGGGYDFMLPM